MNRSFFYIISGGFEQGILIATDSAKSYKERKTYWHQSDAKFVKRREKNYYSPGYGMAVARCQHDVGTFCRIFNQRGCKVDFVSTGHMNALLAEAKVDYSIAEKWTKLIKIFQKHTRQPKLSYSWNASS